MTTIAKNSASARLLALALESGAPRDALAAALGADLTSLEDYVAVRLRMPPAAQLALAGWVERELPRLASRARRLREQVRAAQVLESGVTERHAYPPPRSIR
jgi:hypothetical protein